MSEQVKKRQRIYDLLNAKTKAKKISKIIWVSLWPTSSPDHNLLDYDIWDILENKNATFHPNIGSLKTAIEKEWNKMFEEFILKARKSFQRHVDNKFKKEKKKMVTTLGKFTALCLSSPAVYFLRLELILFYNSHLLLY